MAIQDSFSLNDALYSQSYAYKCWYNYNYGNNTMGISSKDMGQITQTWKSELSNWKATALDDENAYEIHDDDFSTAKLNGRTQAESKTGYNGNQAGQIGQVTSTAATSAAGATGAMIGRIAASKAGLKIGQQVTGKAAKDAAGKGGGKAAVGKAKVGAYIGAVLAIATYAQYLIMKPNKEQKLACDALQDEMMNAQNALYQAQDDMNTADEEVIALSDEAQMTNEDANDTIEDKKSEYDAYKASYDALMEKVEAGEPLTEDEKALIQELIPIMQELGIDIGEIQEDTTDVTGDLYDEIGTYQEHYDNAAETVGEVLGLTSYAESFDSSTQTMCYVEAGAQGLNAATGISSGAQLLAGAFWNWALGIAAIVAGGGSTMAAGEQLKYAGEVGTEIGMRKETQEVDSLTNDIYDERIADYEGYNEIVEDLELDIPDDLDDMQEPLEAPPETPGTNNGGTPPVLGLGSTVGQGNTPSGSSTGTRNGKPTKDKDKDV